MTKPEPTMSTPVQDGAQELREEAKKERASGVDDRADNVEAEPSKLQR